MNDLRKGRLTASRVAPLMTGDREKILRLYEEMIGAIAPEDLSAVWPVQLGLATERLQVDWYERKTGHRVVCRGEFRPHPAHDWAGCTLDGWDADEQCPVEVKHTGGREALEVLVDRYQPQVQFQIECTGAKQAAFSVILGASEPVVVMIERAAEYAAELMRRGERFMACVRERRPPLELPAVAPPPDPMKLYDMTGSNVWAHEADGWLTTRAAAEVCRQAEKALKGLVPADAKECRGHGVVIKRNRAGSLSLREHAE